MYITKNNAFIESILSHLTQLYRGVGDKDDLSPNSSSATSVEKQHYGFDRPPSSVHGMARWPGHPLGGGAPGRYSLWSRSRPRLWVKCSSRSNAHGRITNKAITGIRQDELLYKIAERVKSEFTSAIELRGKCILLTSFPPDFAVIYLCDIDEVPDFNTMYELYDTMTMMFFYRNKHMMCDFGTGNNNKLNWVLEDKQELIDIIETIYKGAKKGRGLVVSPKGMWRLCFG